MFASPDPSQIRHFPGLRQGQRLQPGLAGRASGLNDLQLHQAKLKAPDLASLSRATSLTRLELSQDPSCPIGDAGIAHLGALRNLRYLSLAPTEITDSGLASLRGMARLQSLTIHEGRFTSLEPLRGLTGLTVLSLTSVPVDDAGFAPVSSFHALTCLIMLPTGPLSRSSITSPS
jgi:hypothetical protein